MKSEDFKGNVDTRDELLAQILDAAARKKQLDLRTQVATCTEADGGIFEH